VLRVVGSTAAIGTIEFEPGLQHDPAFCFASLLKGRVWALIVEPVNTDTTRRTNRDDLFKRMVPVLSD